MHEVDFLDFFVKEYACLLQEGNLLLCNYRPRSEGDNALGSVRPSVCPFVCPFVCLCSPQLEAKMTITSLRCLSVSVILGHLWIISRMRSIGF